MISEKYKVIPVAKAIDLSSTVYTDSIYCKDLVNKVCFVFMLNTLGGASSVLTVCSGVSDAACTTDIRFNYAFGGAAMGTATAGSATSCDVLAAWTSAATLTLTYGTYSNFMLVVEVDIADMNSALDHDWLTCKFTTTSSVTGTVNGVAIADYRYPGQGSATVLATA
jgi:hypothetical protein